MAVEALGRGDVAASVELCRSGLAERDDGELHFVLGMAAYVDDRFPQARTHWEDAFRSFTRDGEVRRAARSGIALAELCWDGLGREAMGRGWLERARRLLDDVGPCVEWGYWELARLACDRSDVDALAASAERAMQMAKEFGDTALHVRALTDSGVALVSRGAVDRGLARLDEALACIAAGDVADPGVLGTAFCGLLTAAERLGDVARVTEWTDAIHEMLLDRSGGRPFVLRSHCSIALGGVLVQAGRWSEAEQLLTASLAGGGPARASHRVDAVARLSSLRLLQGRVDEAAELIAAFEDDLAVAAPLSGVHLARGEPELAAAVVRRALDQLPGDALRAAPLLFVLIDSAIATGDLSAAAQAAGRMRELADGAECKLLRSMAALADGKVALASQDPNALAHYDDAMRLLDADERPDLTATAHLDVAECHARLGDPARAIAAARAGHAIAVRIGAAPLRDRAASILRSLGVTAPRTSTERSALLGELTAREREVLDGVCRGDTNAQIAARLFLSPKTVEHHVSRLLVKLGARSRSEAAAIAASVVPIASD